MTLVPFGSGTELVKKSNPWHGFADEGPVLTVLRVQKVPTVQGNPSCGNWVEAAARDDNATGKGIGASTSSWDASTREWQPWAEDELEAVTGCSKMPCQVKLNEFETAQMSAVSEALRPKKFHSLVQERVQRYQKSQERKEYEFRGDPVDPWKVFEKLGLKSPQAMQAKAELRVRKVVLAPGRVRSVRQVVDSRFSASPDRRNATLWRRDVYTDHYFDSWGEWLDVRCDPEQGSVWITQAILLELDLMKKTDVMSKLMRSKMRGATEDNGAVYLDRWFDRLRKGAVASGGG